MRLKNIEIKNFRNFQSLNIPIGMCAVIFGENRVGKSNLLYALRLVLDPSLSDYNRQLNESDFWDGLPRPVDKSENIKISIQLSEFEEDEDLLAILADHLVEPEPMVAELTYEFKHVDIVDEGFGDEYEYICYGGKTPENRFGYEVRKRIPIEVLHALRDIGDTTHSDTVIY